MATGRTSGMVANVVDLVVSPAVLMYVGFALYGASLGEVFRQGRSGAWQAYATGLFLLAMVFFAGSFWLGRQGES